MHLAGLLSIAAVDIGLRTLIGGLNEKYANQEYALAWGERLLIPAVRTWKCARFFDILPRLRANARRFSQRKPTIRR